MNQHITVVYCLHLTFFSFVVITSPPYNFAVSALAYSSLVLSWDEIPLTERHAPILNYLIFYYQVSSNSTETEVLDSNTLSVTIENLQFDATYNFSIIAGGALGDSPATYVETTTPFKGNFVILLQNASDY